MEAYRYQELVYLVVPVILGVEFFLNAKEEKKGKEDVPLGSYVLDLCGFVFTALVPAVFILTIWAIETKAFPLREETLARFDRYAVMFLFMGAWWQVYMIGALRIRRLRERLCFINMWAPFLGLGVFISLLVLWVSPWGLKWVSIIWFLILTGVFSAIRLKPKTLERVFWVLAGITFLLENILFIWLETVV
ncbi:MAG TPA: hypothetical protein ENK09_13070 [Nitrospirae bacterium]|nr:hypothetical protein [Nitrospirota bacterium]